MNEILLGLIGAVVSVLTAAITGYVAIEIARLRAVAEQTEKRNEVVAAKVVEVAQTLANTTAANEVKLEGIAEVGRQTHTLVNARMGQALRLNALTTERLAALTGNEADREAAQIAAELLVEHDAKQATVDAGKS